MLSYVFVAAVALFVGCSLAQQVREDKLLAKLGVNGNSLCAVGTPTVLSPVRSRIECSTRCQNNAACLSINFRDDDDRPPVCEQFADICTQPYNFTEVQNCAHYVHQQRIPTFSDCAAIKASGCTQSGLYTVTTDDGQRFLVMCDMKTDAGGWLVFQRRQDGSVDFYRNWYNYTNGFGDLTGEFWLGNEFLYLLTSSSRQYHVRFDFGNWINAARYVKLNNFKVDSSATFYTMTVGAPLGGTTGNSFSYHSGMMFSTFDADHDANATINCAEEFTGGYWYNDCRQSNPNGLYLNGTNTQPGRGVTWDAWLGSSYSLKQMAMKIRPAP